MPNLPHILVARVEHEGPRRKSGSGRPPARNYGEHGPELLQQLDGVVQTFQVNIPPVGIDPTLILRIQLDANSVVEEQLWERCGLTLLTVQPAKNFLFFPTHPPH